MTLTELARAAGVPHAYLFRIIAGKASPTIETYAKLGVTLGADLTSRLYPNTGPAIRDRHQARILEELLRDLHPRWRPHTEVPTWKPARGWIDVVLHERRENVLVATEIESQLRRLEQVIRWSREKADSLPSWSEWPALTDSAGAERVVSQLLLVRRTRATAEVAKEFARQLTVAFPAHPGDAMAALVGTSRWPGSALVWVAFDHDKTRFLDRR